MSLVGDDTFSGNYWDSIVPGTSGTGTNAAGINAGVNKKTLAWQIWKDAEDRRIAAEALARKNAQDDEDRRIVAEDRTTAAGIVAKNDKAASDLRTNTGNYYRGGTWKDAFTGQTNAANTAAGTATGSVDTNLAGQLGNIAGAYGDATNTTAGAYNDLINYLTQNPNNPYAGQSVSSGQVGNDMSQLMQAYGLDTGPTQQYVGATNAANDSTAQQFNNLLQVLSRMSTSSDASRMTEARSGSTNALSNLAGMNASNVAGANNAATAAKNKIAQDLLAQLSGIDTSKAAEDARLQQLLISLGVDPTAVPGTIVPKVDNPIVTKVDDPVYNDLVERNPPFAFLPGIASGVDESTRVPEVTPDVLLELQKRLAGLGGFGQGFLTR